MIDKANKFYKPYPARVEAITRILDAVMGKKEYADKALERYFKANKKAGSDDRAFISEMVYDAVRHWNYLTWFTGDKFSFKRDGLWLLVGNLLFLKGYELPDWKEFSVINKAQAGEKQNRKNLPRTIIQSVSPELDELGVEQCGEQRWSTELAAMNTPAAVILRINTLKSDLTTVQRTLKDDGINTFPINGYPNALQLETRTNIFRHPHFKDGFFEVQDAGSQTIAPFLNVQPGMRVIDACAGAGGKTLHLASLMQNRGRIVAMDTEAFKLDELRNRATRNGVHIIETRTIDGLKTIKKLEDSADRLLLDVPCTGSGVLKRNPDAKYKIDRAFFARVTNLQETIINNYSRMVSPGGLLVYATCSIFKAENEDRITNFLANNPNFELEEQRMHYPSETGFDGFFMARLKRVN